MMTVICPNGVSVINGVFRGAGGVIFNRMCLIGTFSDHEGKLHIEDDDG